MDLYLAFLGLTLPSLMRFASGRAMCPYPSDSSITGLTAKKYLVGTKLLYQCDPEHFAGLMDVFFYTCKNSNGVNKWISQDCYCHKHNGITTNTEIGNKSSDCEVPTNVNETVPGDYCGPPPSVKNATLDLSESNFPAGQEFHYRRQCNDHDQNRHRGVLKCNSSGAWNPLLDGCISSIHATCIGVAVGGIIAGVVLFAILIIVQWRIKSTGNVKFFERNNVSAQKEEEMITAHVPLNAKQQMQ
ncbi:uncharacterized protein [Eleutherodactylus coqui]|uniref:uncharacterized protein isoform X2 n=1 Tax=Eleutherodactylus coqui TaxID=57060 RepID=UPI00346342D1